MHGPTITKMTKRTDLSQTCCQWSMFKLGAQHWCVSAGEIWISSQPLVCQCHQRLLGHTSRFIGCTPALYYDFVDYCNYNAQIILLTSANWACTITTIIVSYCTAKVVSWHEISMIEDRIHSWRKSTDQPPTTWLIMQSVTCTWLEAAYQNSADWLPPLKIQTNDIF